MVQPFIENKESRCAFFDFYGLAQQTFWTKALSCTTFQAVDRQTFFDFDENKSCEVTRHSTVKTLVSSQTPAGKRFFTQRRYSYFLRISLYCTTVSKLEPCVKKL